MSTGCKSSHSGFLDVSRSNGGLRTSSNSGLCWTVFARNRDTAVPAEGNGDLQTLICVFVTRPRRCLTLSNLVPWQNWMAAYLGYTLRMKTLFRGWPIMAHETHTRTRRSLSLNHHLYADDTQLFLSFHQSDFTPTSVTYKMLYNRSILGWLLIFSLNSSKTEFLTIGHKQQLCKIQDCSLTTTYSARNLGFIFDEHLTLSDQITAPSKSCYYHIRELRCIRPYLDFKAASTIATSIVHSKLDYCISIITFQTVNSTGSNRFKTLLLVLLLRFLNTLISLPFSNLSSG